eukprot:1177203-Prorocentrum_minimum.AAC.2
MEDEWEILSGGSVESWEDLGLTADDLKDYKSPVDLLNAMTEDALLDEHPESVSPLRTPRYACLESNRESRRKSKCVHKLVSEREINLPRIRHECRGLNATGNSKRDRCALATAVPLGIFSALATAR